MTQYARPDSDVSRNSEWTNSSSGTTDLYSFIDEDTADDTDYIKFNSSWSENTSSVRFSLSDISEPADLSTVKVVFRSKAYQAWFSDISGKVILYQGSSAIAQKSYSSASAWGGSSFTTIDDFTLSSAEAGNITDWSDLELLFRNNDNEGTGSYIYISQAYLEAGAAAGGGSSSVFKIASRVKQQTTTTGTGTVDLDTSVDGFQSFVDGIGDGNTTYYVLESGDSWEVGVGTVTDASPDTLSRDTVLASSNSGSKISLADTSDVFCTQPASKAVLLDSDDRVAVNQTSPVSTLDVGGSVSGAATELTYADDSTTLDETHGTVTVDTTGAAAAAMDDVDIILPAAAAATKGRLYTVKKIDTESTPVKVTVASAGTIDGETAVNLFLQNDFITVQCVYDGSSYAWHIIAEYHKPHVASLKQTSAQSIGSGSLVVVSYDTIEYEEGAEADTANEKITVKRAGKYLVSANIAMTGMGSAGYIQLNFETNGSASERFNKVRAKSSSEGNPAAHCTALLDLDVDDYVRVMAYHATGSSRNTNSGSASVQNEMRFFVQEMR
tara:strand:- start:1413 stop:3074 length:1662 start_codon:yes stop_codon:yes gene_type:complete